MRGATAPRLLLELVCARVLLPGADDSTEGIHARLDRLERRLSIPAAAESNRPPSSAPAHHAPSPDPDSGDDPVPQPKPAHRDPQPSAAPTGDLGVVDVRRLWPEVLAKVMERRRLAWVMLSQSAQVTAVDGATLTLAMVNGGARESFTRSGCDEVLRQALIDVLGVDWRVEVVVDPSVTPRDREPTLHRGPAATSAVAQPVAPADEDGGPHPDDPAVDDGLGHAELLSRELGAQVIEEIKHH
jgi:DNA polymerase-3 subunit gamma/tau